MQSSQNARGGSNFAKYGEAKTVHQTRFDGVTSSFSARYGWLLPPNRDLYPSTHDSIFLDWGVGGIAKYGSSFSDVKLVITHMLSPALSDIKRV